MQSLKIGFHVSISGSIDLAVDRAKEAGCTAFQIFLKNPRGWSYKPLREEEATLFVKKCEKFGYSELLAHMPYLPNLASPNDEIYKKSFNCLVEDLVRAGRLRIPYLVLHLGSHMGSGEEAGVKRIVEACRTALDTVGNKVMLLLENTAGQKNSIGSRFKDLRRIMDEIGEYSRVGICFDTCHAYAAGYDLRTEKAVSETLHQLDKEVGFEHVKSIHLNDSVGELGSHLDRHEHIGLGKIGENGMKAILHTPEIRKLPIVMETPVDKRRDDRGNLMKALELAT
ncbi:MAG: deoxyribonuclease IV [Nitrososphaerales archaeon]